MDPSIKIKQLTSVWAAQGTGGKKAAEQPQQKHLQ